MLALTIYGSSFNSWVEQSKIYVFFISLIKKMLPGIGYGLAIDLPPITIQALVSSAHRKFSICTSLALRGYKREDILLHLRKALFYYSIYCFFKPRYISIYYFQILFVCKLFFQIFRFRLGYIRVHTRV